MKRLLDAAAACMLLAFASAWSAAPPSIDLRDDPRLLRCPAEPAGTLKATGAAMLAESGTAYQAGFDPLAWHGSLRKRRISFDAGHAALQPAEWDAADLLAAIEPEARRIYTSDERNATIPFDWEHLTASQKSMLNTSPVTGGTDGLGALRLQYLRGDRRLEQGEANGQFPRRQKLLGAIVNSTPVFAGPPSSAVLEPGYQDFYRQYRQRAAVVFVGADDGMLHAFDADSGRELFAYVPRALLPALAQLTRPQPAHRTYVDGAIRIAEARIGGEWRSVLVAAMRGGAQGVFALDVTDAGRFGEGAGVVWEFTDADDPQMGNVIGAPAVAKLYIGMRKGVPGYRYFAFVAAGLDNDVDDGSGRFDPSGANALFLLALDKPPAEKWKAGSNYYKFVLPAGEAGSANGLSEPALLVDGDGVARHVYAGDLQGNLWRFDFTGAAPWKAAMGAGRPQPLFTARDEHGRRQPITAKPALVFAPGGYLLLFGTGRLLESRDLADAGTQSIYAVRDEPDKRGDTADRRQLDRRSADMRADGRVEIRGNPIPYDADGKGWYLDLPQAGERVLSAADILGHFAYFDTLRPSADPCRPAAGRSYVVDTLSGLPPDDIVTGIPFDPAGDDGPIALPLETGGLAPRGASGKRKPAMQRIRVADSDAKAGPDKGATDNPPAIQTMTAGRLSWRELVDWDGMRK